MWKPQRRKGKLSHTALSGAFGRRRRQISLFPWRGSTTALNFPAPTTISLGNYHLHWNSFKRATSKEPVHQCTIFICPLGESQHWWVSTGSAVLGTLRNVGTGEESNKSIAVSSVQILRSETYSVPYFSGKFNFHPLCPTSAMLRKSLNWK